MHQHYRKYAEQEEPGEDAHSQRGRREWDRVYELYQPERLQGSLILNTLYDDALSVADWEFECEPLGNKQQQALFLKQQFIVPTLSVTANA